MPTPKYYVVWKGRTSGIFDSWHECEQQVKGYVGAVYKSFLTREQAEQAFNSDPAAFFRKGIKKEISGSFKPSVDGIPVWESLSVDAACSGNPGVLEYRGVWTNTGEEIFRADPYSIGTINLGEFLGIVHGLAFLKKQGKSCPVYSDSRTAIKWVKDKAIKTKLEHTDSTGKLFEHIDRALKWLLENEYPNQVLKWDTAAWGEIPADFGRK